MSIRVTASHDKSKLPLELFLNQFSAHIRNKILITLQN